jgi:3-methyladenine DNA glycosylase Tag
MDAACVTLITAQLKRGTSSVATVGSRVFNKQNAAVADAIRASYGSFRAFVEQRHEFRVDGADNIVPVVVQSKTLAVDDSTQSAEAKCVALIAAQLKGGTISVETVGSRVFGKPNAAVAQAIRSSFGSFRAFVEQRPEFRVDGAYNIHLVAVQAKTKAAAPASRPMQAAAKLPESIEDKCASMVCGQIALGECDMGTIGGRIFQDASLAHRIKAVHGSFRAFVLSRSEFSTERTSTGIVIRLSSVKPDNVRQENPLVSVPTKAERGKAHRARKSLQLSSLDPPVSGPGEWVLTEEFTGRKSFGWFECTKCVKCWPSAHAFPMYAQGCQRCNTEQVPKFMWENHARRDDDDDSSGGLELDGPHDQARCEACRHGDCVAAILGLTSVTSHDSDVEYE